MESYSGKLTDDVDGFRMGMFAMNLKTCVVTAEGPVIQDVQLLNVISFSCVCLKCTMCFDNKSALLFHMQRHLRSDENLDEVTDDSGSDIEVTESNECEAKNINVFGIVGKANYQPHIETRNLDVNNKMESLDEQGDTDDEDDDDNDYDDDISDNDHVIDQNDDSCTDDTNDDARGVNIDDIKGTDNGNDDSGDDDNGNDDFGDDDNGNDDFGDDKHHATESKISHINAKEESPAVCGKTLFPCPICGLKFSTKAKLSMHSGKTCEDLKKSHNPEKRQSKERTKELGVKTLAEKTSTGSSSVETESPSRPTSEAKKMLYKCGMCHEEFASMPEMKAHSKRHKFVHGETRFICAVCSKLYIRLSDLKVHTRVHTGEKPYECTVCGKKYTHSGSLTEHKCMGRPCNCTVCGKSFRRERLRLHMLTHNPDFVRKRSKPSNREKPCVCTLCGKSFRRDSLRRHMLTHQPNYVRKKSKHSKPDQKYVCNVCGKTIVRLSGIQAHMAIHEGTSVDCPTCGRNFKHKTSLRRHVRFEHEGKWRTCEICGRSFESNRWLNDHIAKHAEGKLLFKCPDCDQEFTTNGHLRSHSKKQHQENKLVESGDTKSNDTEEQC